MERKQGPRGRGTGRSALLMAGVLAAGVLATAGPTSAAKADGCYGSCGCDNGCGYSSYCGGGCGNTSYSSYCGGGCGYSGVQYLHAQQPVGGRAGFLPFNEEEFGSQMELTYSPLPGEEGQPVTLHADIVCVVNGENGNGPNGLGEEGTQVPVPDTGAVVWYNEENGAALYGEVHNGHADSSPVMLTPGEHTFDAYFSGGYTADDDYCYGTNGQVVVTVQSAPTPPPTPTPPSVKVKVKVVVAPRVRIAIFKGHFHHHMAPAAPARPAVPVTG